MFEESLIESEKKIKTRQGWTTVLSFSLQTLAVTILVLLPLIFTEAIPLTPESMTNLVAPPPPPPPPPPAAQAAPQVQETAAVTETDELRVPVKIPEKIAMIREAPAAAAGAPPTGVVGGVPGGVAGGQMGGVIGGVIGATPTAVPKIAAPNKVRISQGVSEGLLQKQVKPTYPSLAKQARIQGQVVLQAVIGKDGKVQNLQVVSGHPMLAGAALDAVKQWRYKPYFLNGEPVEVETNITVNFSLAG
ncbi:MAG TPA: energy transducer TonB [Terriglobales bacterium]|nr:energy transducer TonB [Terriglobales bacterium]